MQSLPDYGQCSDGFICWRGACRFTPLFHSGVGFGSDEMVEPLIHPVAGNSEFPLGLAA